jgi:hypothetical protein
LCSQARVVHFRVGKPCLFPSVTAPVELIAVYPERLLALATIDAFECEATAWEKAAVLGGNRLCLLTVCAHIRLVNQVVIE